MCVCAFPRQVECTIDRLRETVSSKVWRLLVVDSHLLDHLDAIKRTFLFTRPEDDGEEKPVYAVHSPLHLVLTPSAMERYAELHTFMSRLRNVSFQLQNRWGAGGECACSASVLRQV